MTPPQRTPEARTSALLALSDILVAQQNDLPNLREAATRAVADLCGDTTVLWECEGVPGERDLHMSAWWHRNAAARNDLRELGGPVRLREQDQGFLWSRVTGEPLLLTQVSADALTAAHPAYGEYFRRWGLSSMVLVPLRARGQLLGLLGVSRDASGVPYDDDDLTFAIRVGGQLALALDNARLVHDVHRELARTRAAEAAMRHQAAHDALTGLANRHRLVTELARAGGRAVGLLLIDLDGFKDINDALGHTTGDLVLQEVARRFRAAAPPGAVVARTGGDEFAVLIRDPPEGPEAVAQGLAETLQPACEVDGLRLSVECSIGIATAPALAQPAQRTAQSLLRRADIAMYRAKRARQVVAVYDPELDGAAMSRLQRITDLRVAIHTGELRVHYQPVVATGIAEPHHWEALVRWQHSSGRLIPPGEFIPLAEQSGLVYDLTVRVLQQVLLDHASSTAGRDRRRIAINVPPAVLADSRWLGEFGAMLDMYACDPTSLIIEVTESTAAVERAVQAMEAMRALGVLLALDDFGTGWSSLSVLRTLPLQQLKIDRAFVTDVTTDHRSRGLVRAIVDISRLLDLQTVAEGVETPMQAEVLTGLGVELQQGWVHGRPAPLPADD